MRWRLANDANNANTTKRTRETLLTRKTEEKDSQKTPKDPKPEFLEALGHVTSLSAQAGSDFTKIVMNYDVYMKVKYGTEEPL